MTAFDTDSNLRWLFCMTHPDDEISICAWIKRLIDSGGIVYLSWTHSTPVREKEARAAAARMGVAMTRIHFFEAPDGDVVDHLDSLLPRFRDWIGHTHPDRICCGAFEQGHLDHDATNLLVNTAFEGPVFEIPFYHAYLSRIQRINRFASPESEEVLELTPQEASFKREMAKSYPSTNIRSVLTSYQALQIVKRSGEDLALTERMRLQTHKDFLTPNLPAKLASRVKISSRWRRWEQAVSRFATTDTKRNREGKIGHG